METNKNEAKNHSKVKKESTIETEENVVAENQPQEEATTPSAEDQLAAVKEELASAKDQNLRLYAEFENYKRRNAKERLDLMNSANQDVMLSLLPVVDDFERAIKNTEKSEENKSVVEGLELIHAKLTDTLKQKGLKPMDSAIGKNFDVETMEAITRLPTTDKKQSGKVIDEIEKGYHLGNKVLRYARVVVAHFEEN